MKQGTKAALVVGAVVGVGAYWLGKRAQSAFTGIPAKAGKTYTPPGKTFAEQVSFCRATSRDPIVSQQCLAWLREVGLP